MIKTKKAFVEGFFNKIKEEQAINPFGGVRTAEEENLGELYVEHLRAVNFWMVQFWVAMPAISLSPNNKGVIVLRKRLRWFLRLRFIQPLNDHSTWLKSLDLLL